MTYIILSIIMVVALTLVLTKLFGPKEQPIIQASPNNAYCCGTHDICDKNSLLSSNLKIVYYQDEELDRFIGKDHHQYVPIEIEEIQEILFTLREDEVAGWLRSLQIRSIQLPQEIQDQALMIISERRFLSKS